MFSIIAHVDTSFLRVEGMFSNTVDKQCDQIWRKIASLAKACNILKPYFVLGNILNILQQILRSIVQI